MPAAAAIGYYMKPFMGSEETAHVVLGSLALAFGFLQILALLGRPAPVRSVLFGFKLSTWAADAAAKQCGVWVARLWDEHRLSSAAASCCRTTGAAGCHHARQQRF